MTTADELLAAVLPADLDHGRLAELLRDVQTFIERFVAFGSDAQPVAVALHVAHAHALEAADATGYLHVRSAEKRSGKTRLLEVLELLVPSPIRASSISPSAVFRLLDQEPRTLLLDEIDTVFSPKSDREELRAVLNSGYRRGSAAWRVEVNGKAYIPRAFDVFGAKVLAGLGQLPDTIADRCIPIELRRRRPDEPVEPFRFRLVSAEAEELRERLEAWAGAETIERLRDARPDLPDIADDRALEAWESLLAIADAAGGTWPASARAAAVSLHGDRSDEETAGVATLAAIRDVFGDDRDRVSTEELLAALADRDDGPWPYWFGDDTRTDRDGAPSRRAARKLARLLAPYGIAPRVLKMPDGRTPRGYLRESFGDAWSRYVPGSDATTQPDATVLARGVASVGVVASPDEGPIAGEAYAAPPPATGTPGPCPSCGAKRREAGYEGHGNRCPRFYEVEVEVADEPVPAGEDAP